MTDTITTDTGVFVLTARMSVPQRVRFVGEFETPPPIIAWTEGEEGDGASVTQVTTTGFHLTSLVDNKVDDITVHWSAGPPVTAGDTSIDTGEA